MIWLVLRTVPGQQIPKIVDKLDEPGRSSAVQTYTERYLHDDADGTVVTFIPVHLNMGSVASYFRVGTSVPEVVLTQDQRRALRNAAEGCQRLGDQEVLRALLHKADAQKTLIEIDSRGVEKTR
jgi:hypothetical protein